MAAIYPFKDLQDEVLSWLDEAGDTDVTLTNVKYALNQAHQQRLMAEKWPFLLWPTVETLTLSTTTRLYSLHPEFWRPDYFYNLTSKEFLVETPRRQLAATGERWPSDTGRTPYFRYGAIAPVAAQPSSASVITLVSSSASDVTTRTITIGGIVSGVYQSETLTATGTTPVVGTLSFSLILDITKAGTWVGTATLTTNAGAVTILTLLAAERGRAYQSLELLRTPTSADSVEYRFYRQPKKLVADYDIPLLPGPHAQILVWDALLLFAGYNTDLSEKSVQVWQANQARAEDILGKEWLEGRTLEGEPQYIRYMGEDPSAPRVF